MRSAPRIVAGRWAMTTVTQALLTKVGGELGVTRVVQVGGAAVIFASCLFAAPHLVDLSVLAECPPGYGSQSGRKSCTSWAICCEGEMLSSRRRNSL